MLPENTMILTPEGFTKVCDLKKGDLIYSLDKEQSILVKSPLLSNNKTFEDVLLLENRRVQLLGSSNLKLKGWRRSKARNRPSINVDTEFRINETTQEHNAVLAYPVVEGDYSIGVNEAKLLGYIASDGYWSWSKKSETTSSSNGKKKEVDCSLSQAEHKFLEDIRNSLDNLGAKYNMYEKKSDNFYKVHGFKLSSPWVRNYLESIFKERKDKHDINWTRFLMNLDNESFDAFYQGFYNGDGTLGTNSIAQNPGNIQDGIVACMLRIGKGVVSKNRRTDGTICEVVRYHTKKHITMQEVKLTSTGVQDCYTPLSELGSCVIMQHKFIGTVLTR